MDNVSKSIAPPSEGQTRRNDTITEYFDNGWVKKSSDVWDISTVYDYNDIGKQISRSISGVGDTHHANDELVLLLYPYEMMFWKK